MLDPGTVIKDADKVINSVGGERVAVLRTRTERLRRSFHEENTDPHNLAQWVRVVAVELERVSKYLPA